MIVQTYNVINYMSQGRYIIVICNTYQQHNIDVSVFHETINIYYFKILIVMISIKIHSIGFTHKLIFVTTRRRIRRLTVVNWRLV